MKIKVILIVNLLFISIRGQNEVLDNYIKLGLEHNLTLKQKNFSLMQSEEDLSEATGMFLPSIDLKSRYSRADGGRQIEMPVGDLVNPMQSALNSLNPLFNFPANIPNVKVPFLRKEEQETKLSLVQPIIQPALFYNYSIKKNIIEIKSLEQKISSRKLITDIKKSYLNVLKTNEVIKLFNSTLEVLNENVRINTKLFESDKLTIDHVHRAKAEQLKIEQKLLEAQNNFSMAVSYFNYLLNRSLDDEVILTDINSFNIELLSQSNYEEEAMANREELQQIKKSLEISDDQAGAAKTSYYPGLIFAFDYGFQGEEYKFDSNSDYWMASLVFNWNLFNGFQDNAKAEKAEIEIKKNRLKISEISNQIRLQVREAYNNVKSAQKIIESAKEQVKSSRKSFEIIERKYSEGMASQIEYLDAQNSFTEAQISKLLSQYSLLEYIAKLEEVTASVNLQKFFDNVGDQ